MALLVAPAKGGDMGLGRWVAVLAALGLGGAGLFYALTIPSVAVTGSLPPRTADLANGQTMFNAGGCASCHATPKQDDSRRLGGGLALNTPFGKFHVPNLSSDRTHGIGAWSEEAFVNAMLRGVGRNGEHLYPAFPYTSYQRMKLEDVRDLFAFLRTLPPDTTPNRPHELPFPFNVRRGLGLWKQIYLDGKTFVPDPAKSAVLNRGAYLVEGPSHCAECHSGRDILGGIIAGQRFAGGADPEGQGWIPNITPGENGITGWSEQDIAYLLETGTTPEYDSVGSRMADVVINTGKLPAEDRNAMAAYIKSLPPRNSSKPPAKQP
jgi:mono/diheme cytochrome c family protein